ncbi:transglutaminase domain-containing protein [Capilliphycus salinus ALCB114379]|uniref:transglutaminase domain-containing protein n=1 Tax=Capilliphycus salinus TaxID=2768948 RepID=UPI0039A63AFF
MTYLVNNPTPPFVSSPWPWKEHQTIHPIISSITPDVETSIKSVAQYIAQYETDPYLQVKAIHDYVITRVTYDLDVLQTGVRPSQDAQTVFLTHKAVCEGYANLFKELGRAIGLDVVYIKGKVRQDLAPLDLIPKAFRLLESNYDWTLHAWNAVKIEGNWQLVDTTWDDTGSKDLYSADYLMLHPELMIISHLPLIQGWQLLGRSKNYQSFENQPILTPQFFAQGLTMISPEEYQTTTEKNAVIELRTFAQKPQIIGALFSKINESNLLVWDLLLSNSSNQHQQLKPCRTQTEASKIRLSCQFPEPGEYQVLLFSLAPESHSPNRKITRIGQLKFRSL